MTLVFIVPQTQARSLRRDHQEGTPRVRNGIRDCAVAFHKERPFGFGQAADPRVRWAVWAGGQVWRQRALEAAALGWGQG